MRSIFLVLGLLFFGASAAADTIILGSGEVLIGRILELNDTNIRVRVGYPKEETVDVPRDSVTPESLYSILASRSDPDSAEARVKLAKASHKLGLLGHAIAEYREAMRLDPALRERLDKEISGLRDAIAADLLGMIEAAIANEQLVAARLNLEVLVERYADTPSGKRGATILATVEERVHTLAAGRQVNAKELAAALRKAERLEASSIRVRKDAKGPIIRSSSSRRRREKALKLLEEAWEEIGSLTPPTEGADSFLTTRARIRETLEREYLIFGTYHVGRLSLPRAEDYNVKACELGAEHSTCRRLQEIIVQARISSSASASDL